MRGLFWRKPVTGRHALGAAVTAIPSAPMRAAVPAPTPVVTWEDWQPAAPSSPAAGAVTAPEPRVAPDHPAAPPSASGVSVADWAAPIATGAATAEGQDLSAEEAVDVVGIAPVVAPNLLSEIAALLATGEAWASSDAAPAALHPGVSAAVPLHGHPAGPPPPVATAVLTLPVLPTVPAAVRPTAAGPVHPIAPGHAPVSVTTTAAVPSLPVASVPSLPVPSLPTSPTPVLLSAPEPGRVPVAVASVPVMPTAPPREARLAMVDVEAPAPWTYAVLGVVPSPAETEPEPEPPPAAPAAPHVGPPIVVAAPAAPPLRPAPAAAVVPAVPAPAAPLPARTASPAVPVAVPSVVGSSAVVAALSAPALRARVAPAPVVAGARVMPHPLPSAPLGRSALEAALAELLPELDGGEAPLAQPLSRVQLGFRDGTSTVLDPASDQSQALQELARSLARRD